MALTAVAQGGLAFFQFRGGAALARAGSRVGIARYAWSIAAGAAAVAIIAFLYAVGPRQMFLKRVIGLPGGRIRITRKKLSLNGVPQTEPCAVNLTDYMDSYRDNFPSEPNVRLFPVADEMLATHTRDWRGHRSGGKAVRVGRQP